jgi:hypothetical protein
MTTKTLKDFDLLLCPMDSFIRGNGNFESSMVINAAIDDLEKCSSFQQCFAIPLQHKLFNMETALKWVLFLNIVPQKIIEHSTDDEEFMQTVDEFKEFSSFSCEGAMGLISSIYDLGIQDTILSHLEDDDDDEDDEDEDDEDDNSSHSSSDTEDLSKSISDIGV